MPSLRELRSRRADALARITANRLMRLLETASEGVAVRDALDLEADARYLQELIMRDNVVGTPVSKTSGDYAFDGEIVAVVEKRDGQLRYVVEDDRGLLLIMNAKMVGLDG